MTARKLVPILFVVACGGGGNNNPDPDAPPGPDGPPPPPPPPPGCDYAELDDIANDDLSVMTGTAEQTQLTFTANTVLCGKVNNDHFEPGMMAGDEGLVDIDSYDVAVGADAQVLITFAGAGAEGLSTIQIIAFNAMGDAVSVSNFINDHAVGTANLPAGAASFSVIALNPTAPGAAIDYKFKIVSDQPDVRCPKSVAAADVTELNDGGQNKGNDLVEVRFATEPARALTAAVDKADNSQNDATPTPLVVANAAKVRITGSIANVESPDEYKDRDSYLIETGADANQLTVRLDWNGLDADHDFVVFEAANQAIPVPVPVDIVSGTLIGDTAPEFVTFAAKPSTRYFIWTGVFDTQGDEATPTPPVLPNAYDISVCGESFTP